MKEQESVAIDFSDVSFQELKKNYFPIFQESFMDAVNRMTKTLATFENVADNAKITSSSGVSIVIGIMGMYPGNMVMDMTEDTALKLSGALFKKDIKSVSMASSILSEFTNIVVGNACSMLNRSQKKYSFRVAPPTIVQGDSMKVACRMKESTTCLSKTSYGDVNIQVGFSDNENLIMEG